MNPVPFRRALLFSITIVFSLLFFSPAIGQSVGDYRSIKTGYWDASDTWEVFTANSWVAATIAPNFNNGVISIQNGHEVSIRENFSVDQLTVDVGGTLTIGAVGIKKHVDLKIVDGPGTDLVVKGKVNVIDYLESSNSILYSGSMTVVGTIQFFAASTYEHNRNGGAIPTAKWDPQSNCIITGYTNSGMGGLGQVFGNFTWDIGRKGSAPYEIPGSGMSVAGDFTVIRTGQDNEHYIEILQEQLHIGGDLIIKGGTLRVGAKMANTYHIKGSLLIENGTLMISWTGNGIINVAKDFSFTGGKIITGGATIAGSIVFNGTGTQIYTADPKLTIGFKINFTVNNGATLQMADERTYVKGLGTFTLSNGATLGLKTQLGINGCIQVTGSKVFDPAANYIFNGNKAQVTGDALSTANNVTINNPEGVSLSKSTVVNGTLSQLSGNINTGTNNLTINGTHIAGTNIISGTGTYILANGATLRTANIDGISGTIATSVQNLSTMANYEFNGTIKQTTGTNIPSTINNLIVNNPNGVSLSQPLRVNGTLTLLDGQLTTSATSLLTINDNATVTGASNASYLSGPVKKIGNDAFAFPVGKNGKYVPIEISAPVNETDAFTAEYFSSSAAALGPITSKGLLKVSDCEYWDLKRSQGSSSVDVKILWNENNACSGSKYISDPLLMVVAHFDEKDKRWNAHGGRGEGSITQGFVIWKNVSEFSPFSLGTIPVSDPLPVRFSKVNVSEKPTGVQIDFTNLTESDVEYYEIERSTDDISYISVKRVEPAKNDNGSASYTYLDTSAPEGRNVYRIKAVETTGNTVYSGMVSITLGAKNRIVNVHASGGQLALQINALPAGKYQFRIFSAAGQLLKMESIDHPGGSFTQTSSLNSAGSGVYIFSLSGPVQIQKKFVVQYD